MKKMSSRQDEKVIVEFASNSLKMIDEQVGLGNAVVHAYLLDKLKDRIDLNSFIAVLRAGMRDKLGDGVN